MTFNCPCISSSHRRKIFAQIAKSNFLKQFSGKYKLQHQKLLVEKDQKKIESKTIYITTKGKVN